ncbi:unnamed protein product [Didymodactylos carnosus]|uniref:Uncharacterized protein n=1 Tax=Didymodactylos carnosus TaxID=1234261 RepID=A0A813Q4K9_9BILA|nr:unnamed protein product [Didymodactylos carnosus]CAF0761969.1 unnamed protein product [Didymodactylos carnosus]CAF3526140.1 unnamed protein product [Didymodactylos carnosus]CAF3542984.1 unnamed protein product [Didymodactylos carnosus]
MMSSSSSRKSLTFETKWHSTATTSYVLHQRPSYPLSDISTNCTMMKISSTTKMISTNKFQTSNGSCTESDECETGDLLSSDYPTQMKLSDDSDMSDIALFLNHPKQVTIGADQSENSLKRPLSRLSSTSLVKQYSSSSQSKLSLNDDAKSLLKKKIMVQKQRSTQRLQLYEDLKVINHKRIQVIDELIHLDEQHEEKVKQLAKVL